MLGRRSQKPPTRVLAPNTSALPHFGPEATGLTPRLSPSIYCSWCGLETEDRKGIKVCPTCDSTPANFT